VNLFSVLSEHGNQCSVVDRMAMLQRYAHGPCHAIPCVTDMEVLSKAKKEVLLWIIDVVDSFLLPLRLSLFLCFSHQITFLHYHTILLFHFPLFFLFFF
jgi:hypothetical protein